jgi:hypothetical protein
MIFYKNQEKSVFFVKKVIFFEYFCGVISCFHPKSTVKLKVSLYKAQAWTLRLRSVTTPAPAAVGCSGGGAHTVAPRGPSAE